jgi:hypothetical protein
MSYSSTVPATPQSPALLPAQAAVNWTRLKTLINSEHVFNDTAQADDGAHRQMTMVARVDPTPPLPAGTNAMLYTRLNGVTSVPELVYFDGTTNWQITPLDLTLPIRVANSISLAAGATNTIYNVSYDWTGTGYAYIAFQLPSPLLSYSFCNIIRIGGNTSNQEIKFQQEVGLSRPTFQYSGGALEIKNNSLATQTVCWSLILNRIS